MRLGISSIVSAFMGVAANHASHAAQSSRMGCVQAAQPTGAQHASKIIHKTYANCDLTAEMLVFLRVKKSLDFLS